MASRRDICPVDGAVIFWNAYTYAWQCLSGHEYPVVLSAEPRSGFEVALLAQQQRIAYDTIAQQQASQPTYSGSMGGYVGTTTTYRAYYTSMAPSADFLEALWRSRVGQVPPLDTRSEPEPVSRSEKPARLQMVVPPPVRKWQGQTRPSGWSPVGLHPGYTHTLAVSREGCSCRRCEFGRVEASTLMMMGG